MILFLMSIFDVTKEKMLDLIKQNANKSLVHSSKIYYKELKFGIKKNNIIPFNNSLE